jgi:hypothetical protein
MLILPDSLAVFGNMKGARKLHSILGQERP